MDSTSLLEQLLAAGRTVQRQLFDGLPPGQPARVDMIRNALESAPIEAARQALSRAGLAAATDEELIALRGLVQVLEPSRSIVRAGGEPQRVIDQLWALGTAWDPGTPLRTAARALGSVPA